MNQARSAQSMTAPKSETNIARMFDRIAGRYDLLNRMLSARQDVRWRRNLCDMVPYRPEGVYLDMATGTGDVILEAAAKHPEYHTYIGADISTEMMKLAEKKAIKLQMTGVIDRSIEWRTMSAEHVDMDSGTCDCLSISFGLRNVINKNIALSEFSRVLKDGGVLLILEFFTPQGGVISRLFQLYFHYVLPLIGRFFSEKEAYSYLPKSVASFYSPQELREALRERGLKVEREKNFLFGACRLVKARKLNRI